MKTLAVISVLVLITFTTTSCFLFFPFNRTNEPSGSSDTKSETAESTSPGDSMTSGGGNSQIAVVTEEIVPTGSDSEYISENSGSSTEYSEISPSPENTPTPVQTGYEKGILTSTSLQSRYLNISFTAPSGYIMLTPEEIDSLVTFVGETIYKDANQEEIDYAKAQGVYEMFVQDPSGIPNMSIIVEKTTSGMTYINFANSLKEQLNDIDGMDYTFSQSLTDAAIAGTQYKKLSASLIYMEYEMKQDIYLRLKDDRMISITMTYSDDTKTTADTLLNAIKAY